MTLFTATHKPVTLTLRVFSHLLGYPDADLRAHLPELRAALHEEGALGESRLREVSLLIDRLGARRPLEVEAAYVELFDRGRGTALYLFEHVHGDSRDRGPAMVDLVKTYEEAGLLLNPGELPDHLSVALQYASTQPSADARAFLGEVAHILKVIFTALQTRKSAYACVLAGLLELAGEKVQAVTLPAEDDLDEAWEEPVAFDGCSIAGQSAPGHAAGPGQGPGQGPVQPAVLSQAVTISDWQPNGVGKASRGADGKRAPQGERI